MSKYTSRIWSLATLLVIVTFVLSFSLSQPTQARPINNDSSPAGTIGPRVSRSQKPSNAITSALKGGNFVSLAEPSEPLLNAIAQHRLGAGASQQQIEATAAEVLREWKSKSYHGPNPKAYEKLVHNEQRALAANSSPAALGLAVTGTLRLLTVAVEFAGTDTATVSHPVSAFGDRTCVTETLTLSGPLHGQIPAPGPRDNQTFWRPTFEKQHYEQVILSTEGITERVRPDLIDPVDGKPGIDVSGSSMRNYYEEVSGGRVQFDAGPKGVIAWLQVPHSEAYYGADVCIGGDPGFFNDYEGLPSNPRFGSGPATLAADIVDQINATDPNFPWQDYDTNGDGIIDHVVIFHAGKDKSDGGGIQDWQAIWAHRGFVDPEEGGYVADNGGTPDDLNDDIRLLGYTMQYEDVDPGVLVHEFGHDLGLPDLYTTDYNGDADVGWWDVMNIGSNTGKLTGTTPTHMSAWSKFALGWTDPQVIEPTSTGENVRLGQTSNPPSGTTQAVRVNLPSTVITYTELLPGSTQAWWTGNDQDWADVRLTRDVDLTGKTGPISVSFDIDYVIEEDWDYLFLEVSTDGGQTYTQTKGFEVGSDAELTTPDDYPDLNGRLGDYGDLVHGYTGDSGGWIRSYHDLTSFAGQNIKLRFRYATDAAFLERGAFIDNIAITNGNNVIFSDPVEGNNTNGWTAIVDTFDPTGVRGAGWQLSSGTELKPLYYLLEWRNFDGFDEGLRYTYNSIFSTINPDGTEERRVDKVPSNAPGMLVWLRDTRFGNDPFGANQLVLDTANNFTASPSEGPKAGLLIVDAHPQPLRAPRNRKLDLGYGSFAFPPLDNWNGRVQSTNAAFNLQGTYGITLTFATGSDNPATTVLTSTYYDALPNVAGFHDALGYFPGVEALPEPVKTFEGEIEGPGGDPVFVERLKPYAFSDPDASVVIPAKGYYPPRTPAGFTGRGAEASPPSFNVSTFETLILDSNTANGDVNGYGVSSIGEAGGTNITGQHSGNPGSDNLQYGYHFQVVDQAASGSIGTIRIWNAMNAGEVDGDITTAPGGKLSDPVTVTASALNAGSPAVLTLYSDFDETQATYVEGSVTNGAIPVTASLAEVQQAASQGVAALAALRVAASEATAVIYTPALAVDTGAKLSFSYQLIRKAGFPAVQVVNRVTGPSFSEEQVLLSGSITRLPIVVQK